VQRPARSSPQVLTAGSIQVFDSLSGELLPLPCSLGEAGQLELRLYVCGVTPYDTGHMGHAFTFLSFDVLVRWAEANGIRVRYVQNVTDVDDPLFERARRDGVDWQELGGRETGRLLRDMELLGWRAPDHMPMVSGEMDRIIEAVERLAGLGCAYQTDRVYFPVRSYPGYGELSKLTRLAMTRKLSSEGLLGEVGPDAKRDPLDFPLWRPSDPGEPAWPSAFGPGRPGWHIECSAMAMHYLGEQVDVHGGGRDLRYSHHESERAQSETLTGVAPFARAWMHVGMVSFAGHKMSKSLGNLVVVEDVLARFPPAAVRLYLASHHYRRDWSFTWEGLEAASRLCSRLAHLLGSEPNQGAEWGAGEPAQGELEGAFGRALDHDLDTAAALGVLRRAVSQGARESARWMTSILCGSAALR